MKSAGLMLLLMLPVAALAEMTQTHLTQSAPVISEPNLPWNAIPMERALQEWDLTESEWQSYRDLMQGRARYFAADMPPPMVLAMFAESQMDRDHFVEKLVRFERDKLERLIAVQDAYDSAYQKLYPNDQIMDLDRLRQRGLLAQAPFLHQPPDERTPRLGDRLALFVTPECQSLCVDRLKRLATQYSIAPLEAYFKGGDKAFKQWRDAAGIDATLIRKKQIMFVRDEGQSEQFKAQPGDVFLVRGKSLYEMELP